MPIVPIGVGDIVRLLRVREDYYERHPDSLYSQGTVLEVDETDGYQVHVRWTGVPSVEGGWFDAAELEALCGNCGMVHEEHADNEKCLYAPTYWKGPSP